ncbi:MULTISPECIES: molybdopterin-guanine dinucleotide biosynthesis protein B [Campylobacter]|uniref:Molybdenum cofactor guanylyltransferase protein B n=3 Tax=Campylobacter fetus TaxID=196 RepID=A0AAE6IYL3_CAMFE|nr:molybdopterin-guanine dinucleotide biosynthesis protein B [Campylobacter fetus subsp. fetus 82-40]AHE94267.1 molybdenum cofactor guanylyltransferase protein B [Campylobacter fetus subsp. venerealis cfvi03/293]AIR80486.1 molybdenum cofactor guanylyltransferase protein B [Campylobacter fetus subsp. venerealis 97/608]EAH8299512.1 molybdopterin-guanine dinucleotide biosynthesis protein MobB [Campylobacter fetus]EGU23905.1 molybdopterin-guanine dinucleotide biosynthesis protein B [Campylobacter f
MAVSGRSGSGKTTLIAKIASKLIEQGYKVAITKHDPGDKSKFDKEGKDSYLFSSLGADVAVVSPKRTTVLLQSGLFGGDERVGSEAHDNKTEEFSPSKTECENDLKKLISYFGEFDYLIVEGLKFIPLPRISVFRDEVDDRYKSFSDAYATNLDGFANGNKPKFGLDDIENIIKWIDNNAKRV